MLPPARCPFWTIWTDPSRLEALLQSLHDLGVEAPAVFVGCIRQEPVQNDWEPESQLLSDEWCLHGLNLPPRRWQQLDQL